MSKKHSEGKLTQSDEGEFEFKIAPFEGPVIMDWGRPVQWIGLKPAEARGIADAF
jgi:hypothetical protein